MLRDVNTLEPHCAILILPSCEWVCVCVCAFSLKVSFHGLPCGAHINPKNGPPAPLPTSPVDDKTEKKRNAGAVRGRFGGRLLRVLALSSHRWRLIACSSPGCWVLWRREKPQFHQHLLRPRVRFDDLACMTFPHGDRVTWPRLTVVNNGVFPS